MGATSDERLKVLQMLEEGKITAEEAATLLRALEGGQRARSDTPAVGGEHRFLRIQVTDMASGTAKVNVTVPIGLVQAGLRIAERFAPDEFGDLDVQEIMGLIAEGAGGKIVEVTDMEDNERVEIYIE
ncbi:MAG TPA: hypothetical protein ENK08_09825 [Chloroflexi bacterium]|nr:hypothetical protein [Chloroflexota bacterium]